MNAAVTSPMPNMARTRWVCQGRTAWVGTVTAADSGRRLLVAVDDGETADTAPPRLPASPTDPLSGAGDPNDSVRSRRRAEVVTRGMLGPDSVSTRPGQTGPVRDAYGTDRRSPLLPGLRCVHADLHNHTRLSDGQGDPRRLFGSLREAGLDVAAVTDHANLASQLGRPGGVPLASALHGISPADWQLLREIADAGDEHGRFVAIRGFEWSHPLLGHVNVWDSPGFTHPRWPGAGDMRRFWDWVATPEAGGALASFNHPGGRGTVLRFAGFTFREELGRRLIGLEMFNKSDDYLLAVDAKGVSPLVQCLAAGWRPGLLGVTDEHGSDWGHPDRKGRTGLYVDELSRAGVATALQARRCFASRVKGMRLAATLGGVPMGGELGRRRPDEAHQRRSLSLAVDLDLGPLARGMELSVQLLRPSSTVPSVEEVARVRSGAAPSTVEVPVHDEPWLVLRICDPVASPEPGSTGAYAHLGRSIAYASPWYLEPATRAAA